MFEIGNKVLCKRTMVIGNQEWYTEGKWYEIVYNMHDAENTFTTRDNIGQRELHIIYKDEEDMNLPRTYSKWFYNKKEMRKMKLEKLNQI